MTALKIILSIVGGLLLLVLLLLVFGKVRVYLDYHGELWITYRVLGIKFIYLKPKKKPKAPELFDLTDCKNPEKTIQKNLKLQRKRLAKLERKQRRSDLKWAKKKVKKQLRKLDFQARELSYGEIVTFVWDLLKAAYRATKGKLKLKIRSLKITVGSPDPATTALLYGGISASLAGLLDFLDANWIPLDADPGAIAINPDFTAKTSGGEVRLTVTVSLWRVAMILLAGERAQTKEFGIAEAHKEERIAAKNPSAATDSI